MKRILSLILSLVMVMSLSVTAFAAEGDNTKDVTATYTPTHTFSLKLAAVDSDTNAAIEATGFTADLSTDPATTLNTTAATEVSLTSGDYTLTNWAGFPTGYKGISEEVKLTVDAATGTISISSTSEIASIDENGVITIKLVKDTTPSITGMSIAINGVEQTGDTVTIKTTDRVTVTVSGANFAHLDENIKVNVTGTAEVLNTTNGWTIDSTNNTATKTYSGADFASVSKIQYSNDAGSNWTDCFTVTYTAETISVDISWGAMSFTYSDETNAWSCADGANKVTVSNTGDLNVNASVAYTQAEGYSGIFGSFDASSAVLASNDNKAFALTLSGKPSAALNNQKIGTITVAIAKAGSAGGGETATVVTTFAELQAAVNNGGTVKLGGDITLEDYLNIYAASPLLLDLNGHTITGTNKSVYLMSGTCTIRGGSITVTSTNAVNNFGDTLTIDQCTISSASGSALYSGNADAVTTVKNSTLSRTDDWYVIFCSSGTISLECTVNLTGKINENSENGGKVTVLAGTYNFDPTSYVDADTYTVTDNGDGTWTVAEK